MAPSKTSRAGKTPRPAARARAGGGFGSRTPSKPNKSILNFFHKVDRPEEGLFVGDAPPGPGPASAPAHEPAGDDGDEDDDLFGDGDDGGPVLEERFNEARAPSKRRRLGDGARDETKCLTPAKAEDEADGTAPPPNKPARAKKPQRGPFLDDSDSDSDDGDEAAAAPPPPPPPVDTPKLTPLKAGPAEDEEIAHRREPIPDSKPAPLLRQATSNGPVSDEELVGLEGFDEEDVEEGEEFREMRFAKEQVRLEAEASGSYNSHDDGFETLMQDDSMTESCPICNASLEGVSADDATVHVNSCLDGSPTPLPRATKPPPPPAPAPATQERVPGAEVGKRFARAAVARPGQANPITLGGGPGPAAAGPSTSAFTKLMSGHAEDTAWATAAAAEHASRGRPAYERTCPFYKIMPGLFICVDAFRYGAVKGCRAYFLSHFHSDHYVGLTASWAHGPIYCSRVTGSLVRSQLRVDPKYVVELDFEQTAEVPGTEGVRVTMIPANHCPGSSLFLFEKQAGAAKPGPAPGAPRVQRILHCGDFRACAAHVAHPLLRPETVDALGRLRQQKIDVCYLDTTYLNPRYSFPPQADVIGACAELCYDLNKAVADGDDAGWDRVLRRRGGAGGAGDDPVSRFFVPAADKKPPGGPGGAPPRPGRNRLLVVCGTYSIGKERICKAIAQRLGSRIFATPAKARIVRQLGDPELAALLTPDPAAAQVHMQSLFELRPDTLADYLGSQGGHFARVVGFRPSGWSYRPQAGAGGGGTAPASLPPASLPTAQLLHAAAWRPRLRARDLAPQRGSTRAALCFGVPYSEHSSFRELALFVLALRVERVVPTVNVGSEAARRRMRAWTDRWLAERRRGGVVTVLDRGGAGEGGEAGGAGPALWEGKDGRGGGVYW